MQSVCIQEYDTIDVGVNHPDEETAMQSGKKWPYLLDKINPIHIARHGGDASFRLITGHYYRGYTHIPIVILSCMIRTLFRKSKFVIFLLCDWHLNAEPTLAMAGAARNWKDDVNKPIWCEEKQIYIGGVPEKEEVRSLIEESGGYLRIFGYGSLCWSPGTGALSKPGVTTSLGRVRYKRAWAQRSTDHRGTVNFPGIVCTLLTDSEVRGIRTLATNAQASIGREVTETHHDNDDGTIVAMTEGVVFNVPPELVQECLEELDFREKGGYARDVCEVVDEKTQHSFKALLYRGTPDNPAFSRRALLDLPFAAAIMAVSAGPSGKNDEYLNSLDVFLDETHAEAAQHDDTKTLASMVRAFQQSRQLYFLSGGGSNQHNQLLLNRPHNAAFLIGEDAHERKEIVLSIDRHNVSKATSNNGLQDGSFLPDRPTQIFAGGGHSGLLLESGRLLLWGWNDSFQCGRRSNVDDGENLGIPKFDPLPGILVERVSLGFAHTLVVEKGTGKLFAFGDNERGQVTGQVPSDARKGISIPSTPEFLKDDRVVAAGAGLFHSAVISSHGDLIAFGCNRFGQSLTASGSSNHPPQYVFGRWKPQDAKCVHVACGQRHTVVCDDKNRIWTFGDNKHGQLGRLTEGNKDPSPAVVASLEELLSPHSTVKVHCGWSHTIVECQSPSGDTMFYGFGRNDKGQLGTGNDEQVPIPKELLECGSESTMLLDKDGNLFGCGWNEHGNLGTGDQNDRLSLSRAQGVKVSTSPDILEGTSSLALAVGGAHFITASVFPTKNIT